MAYVHFTKQEKADMLRIYIQANRKRIVARREYMRQFPRRRAPSTKMFGRVLKNVCDKGSVVNLQRNREKRVLTEDTQINILAFMRADPTASIRRCATETGISYGSIQRLLKVNKFHPYKAWFCQKLSDQQKEKRYDFCYEMIRRFNEDPSFLDHLLWTDESNFSTSGKANPQNVRYWDTENPHYIHEVKKQGHQSVNVWCGIVSNFILGPIFYHETLTRERYLALLEHEISDLIDDLPLNVSANLIWQQDGAPPHSVAEVRDYLNQIYGDLWIGRGGPIPWPPNSPDLSLMDFFLGGMVKNMVYETPCHTMNELIQRITGAIQQIRERPLILLNAKNHVLKVFNKCIEKNGSHVEPFL